MWVAKIELKHDCIIGNRCKKFKCNSVGYPLDFYHKKGYNYFFHFEKLEGDEKNVSLFIGDLEKSRGVEGLEAEGNVLFFTYKTKSKGEMPSQSFLKKVIHLKPVLVDKNGVEHWEVGTWKKDILMNFIRDVKDHTKGIEEFKLLKIVKSKLHDVHFPHVMPLMTSLQQKALKLAQEEGYYEFPRKIELKDLARIMGVSLSTYREHLRKAERSVLKGV